MVILTELAAEEIKRILESQSLEANTVLRMNIAAGGLPRFAIRVGIRHGV